jgi:agmatinase
VRTLLPNPRKTPRFAGVPTFCRFPLLDQVEPANRPVDWAVYGAPFDTGVTYRPGARFGPRSIRIESQYVKPFHVEHDINITEHLSLADAGDAPVQLYDCKANADVIADFAGTLGDPKHTKLFAVGGDHSIALANIRATHRRHGERGRGLALLHFDSHVDTLDITLDEKYSHASPFIRAIEEGILDPTRMLSIGIKGPLNTAHELDYAREHGITIVTREDLLRDGLATIDAFLSRLGDDRCYLTFDIDFVDPAFAPGTGTPSIGGPTSTEALALLRRLARGCNGRPPNIVGADVVEVLPDRDVAGITALLASHVMFEILSLDALRRRSRA